MRGALAACLLGMLLAIGLPAARAQVPESPHLRVLGPRDGLPTSTTIYGLDRDRAGFLWIASSDGLARYDGSGFRIWRHQADDPRALPGNWVQTVHVDARDRVWTSTEFGGISMLDNSRNGFRHWRRETHPALRSNDIFAFASRGDMLWFATDAGLYRMSLAGDPGGWAPELVPGTDSDVIPSLAIDPAGRLWIATLRGLSVLEDGKVKAVPLPGESPLPFVYTVLVDGPRIWIGTAAGIFRRETDGRWLRLPYAAMFERPNAATALARGHDGALWIGSQRGLWRVSGDDATPYPILSEPQYQPGSVPALLVLPEGGLWTALPGLGLGYLRSDWRAVAQLRQSVDGTGLLGTGYRVVARARQGGMWMAGLDGHVERVDGNGVAERLGEAVRLQLPRAKPLTMLEDSLGQLWLYYGRTGLWRIGRDGRLDSWLPGAGADGAADAGYETMVETADGRLWLSQVNAGLETRDIRTGRRLRVFDAESAGLGDGGSEAIRLGPDGHLWVASSQGLGWFDEAAGRVVVPPGLRGERVFAFAFDGEDALWLHRIDGLGYHQRGNGDWRQAAKVPAGRELPSMQVGGLEVDARGRVWLSGQRGILRWDPQRGHLAHFGIQHGLTSQEFVERAFGLSAQGMLAAATRDGSIVLVDTRQPDLPARVPTLRLDAIDVRRDGVWLPRSGPEARSFAPDDREFRITGHLLAYDDPSGTRYWSRLEGFDRDWVAQGAQGERIFSGLGPGRYRLRMRAIDDAGNAAREQVLAFEVRPPWWRTKPALAAGLLLAGALLAWAARDYRRRLDRGHALAMAEQKRTLAEQASDAKTRFLATLGHEIRTPMTGVLGMAELLQSSPLDVRQRSQVDAIWHAGRHLLRLVNDALDLARIEAGKLVLAGDPFDLQALVDEAVALMRPMAERKGLAFSVNLAPDGSGWRIGDRTRIEQILLNLLGNAIKFTERGEVGLVVEAVPADGVRFIVHDTGPGLNDEQRQRLFRRFEQAEGARTSARYGGSGLGLAISQELAAMMGGRIRVDSTPGVGTRFHVELPLPVATAPARASRDADAPAAASLRLLLVEDDATVAEVLCGLLRAQGHEVRHAPHGLAALAEVASGRFDTALLDLDLPGMDGFALARQLRADGFAGPLLAVTARADAEVEELARAAGFDAFLRKPVTSELLAAGLAEAARMRATPPG